MNGELRQALRAFGIGEAECTPLSGGTIHRTYLVQTRAGERFVLQELHAFPNQEAVMENIARVTAHLRAKGLRTLHFRRTAEGWLYDGRFRLMEHLPGRPPAPEQLKTAGFAFGRFAAALADAQGITAAVPGFHNTQNYVEILRRQPLPPEALPLYDRLLPLAEAACDLGPLPLRIIHGDTKLSNVLIDAQGEAAVIDLDTVMPGAIAYDYGDGIRSALGGVPDLRRFRDFTEGYLRGFPAMTEAEVRSLVPGILCVTAELAVRYLTDYAQGCAYFRKTPEATLQRVQTLTAFAETIRSSRALLQHEIENIRSRIGTEQEESL